MEKKAIIEIRGLTKSFEKLDVLKGIDLDIYAGETLVILGGSGSGKSVLISMLVGLLIPDSGEINIDGYKVTDFSSEEQWDEVRLKFGFLFQGAALFDSMTVGENISFIIKQHIELEEVEVNRRIQENLKLVGLPGIENKMPAELSGGMQKRVALARSIALRPPMIIYDEPTTGLDPLNSEMIANLINQLAGDLNVTSIVVTHDLPCAFRIADRICLLKNGRMAFTGTPGDAVNSSELDLTEFLNAGEIPKPTF